MLGRFPCCVSKQRLLRVGWLPRARQALERRRLRWRRRWRRRWRWRHRGSNGGGEGCELAEGRAGVHLRRRDGATGLAQRSDSEAGRTKCRWRWRATSQEESVAYCRCLGAVGTSRSDWLTQVQETRAERRIDTMLHASSTVGGQQGLLKVQAHSHARQSSLRGLGRCRHLRCTAADSRSTGRKHAASTPRAAPADTPPLTPTEMPAGEGTMDWCAKEYPTFVSHLECSMTGKRYEAGQVHGLSEAGRPLLVRYDYDAMARAVTKEDLASRAEGGFWRYRELLPVTKTCNILPMGEVMTPLMPLDKLAPGKGKLLVKDEGRLPTGSFKARGLALAVAMAKELGLQHLAMPTNGNAGAAMAAYAARAGLKTTIFCPADTPEVNISEIELQGATVYRVNGLINDCGKIVGDGKEPVGWFDCSTLKEPYRIEGKKTMGLELAEQLGWRLPDVIFYPTGGGTGLIGMWKAFDELEKLGWIGSKRPRMVAVQASGCAPIVRAWERGEEHAPVWENAHTVAAGIRVPVAVGDFLIIRAVNESGGFGIAVDDDAIEKARVEVATTEGILLCPEGAATYAAYKQALADGRVSPEEEAVLYNCATGLKYPMPKVDRALDRHQPIDYSAM